MQFGIFSRGERGNPVARQTYDEDLFEIVTADELGFCEAWVTEHVSDLRPDLLPSADLLIVKAAALTKQIRMGPAVRPLPYYHPLRVAAEANLCDHLTGGRYMCGFGNGAGSGPFGKGYLMQGIDKSNADPMQDEAMDLILKAWTAEEPFDYDGRFWQGNEINVIPKSLQQPHVPVALATKTPYRLEMAGQKGFILLMSHNAHASQIREWAEPYLEAARAAGRSGARNDIRLCRFIYVSETFEQAKDELRPSMEPSIEFYRKHGHFDEVLSLGDTGDDVSLDYLVDRGHYIVGDPDRVYHRIKDFYDEMGGFGTLLLVTGKEYGTREQRVRSLRLFMEAVAPRLARLDPVSERTTMDSRPSA